MLSGSKMTEDEKAWGQEFVAKATQGKSIEGCIVLYLESDGTGKRWPGASARSVLALAISRGYHCFLFDSMDIIGTWCNDGVTKMNHMGLDKVIPIIAACDILFCVDNSIFKIGTHFKKKVVPLFGFVPSNDINTNFVYKKDVIMSAEEVFFIIDNWIETSKRSDEILGDIRTFEM